MSTIPTSSLQNFVGTLVLVGAGKMGGAMLEGWLRLGLDPARVVILELKPSDDIAALVARGVRLNPALAVIGSATIVMLAIKPQEAPNVVPGLAPIVTRGTLVISIMAGRTLAFMEAALQDAAAIRAMPNTPAAIGRGITVGVANARVTQEQRGLAHALLAATGSVEWVEDERLIDAVTAVSGSGPAYVFLLAESLARAGVEAGLPPALAEKLARETVAGSGELLHRSALDPATLRKNVTSPGGTTAAALEVLMEQGGLDALMERAVGAATKRSRDLAG